MTDHLKTDVVDGVMTLTISRPEKKNALTGAMYDAMSEGLERAERDPAVKVVLFQGDGRQLHLRQRLGGLCRPVHGKRNH
jgi:enoyl-CoA hydratase/carnithine racemase